MYESWYIYRVRGQLAGGICSFIHSVNPGIELRSLHLAAGPSPSHWLMKGQLRSQPHSSLEHYWVLNVASALKSATSSEKQCIPELIKARSLLTADLKIFN